MLKINNFNTDVVKQIRTANGPKPKESLKSLVLPYEHICQNLCDYNLKNNTVDEDINLKNLSEVIVNIYSSIKNLYLESDSTKIADELGLLRDYKCSLIVDATTKKNGQNTRALREASKLSGIDICFGYTLKEDFFCAQNNFNFEKVLNEVRYELAYGYEDLIPSFLGEIIISESKLFPNQNEDKNFEIMFKVVEEFGIPIFIKLNYDSLDPIFNIFEYFEKKTAQFKFEKKHLVFIYSVSVNESKINLDIIKENILSKGFSLILTTFGCDLVLAEKLKTNKTKDLNTDLEDFFQIDHFFSKQKLEFIAKVLLLDDKKYISQIMLSNNINFRIQLKKYGGFGYANLFRHYFDKIIFSANLNDAEVSLVFCDNLINLLAWWEPPKKSIKKVKMIICSKCGIEKEDSDEIFRKFENVYCSVKCLRQHSIKK